MPSGRFNSNNPDEGPSRPPRLFDPRSPKTLVLILIFGALGVLLVLGNQQLGKRTELTWSQVKNKLENRGLLEMTIYVDGGGPYSGKLTPGTDADKDPQRFVTLKNSYPPWHILTEEERNWIVAKATATNTELKYVRTSAFLAMLPQLLLIVLAVGLIWYLMTRYRGAGGPGSVLSFGKSRATLVSKEKLKTTFKDVAGIEEAKEEVQEIISFLKDPRKFQRLGGRIPKGVLLVGPPGTGKTLLARAIAGEADVPFYAISGSDFVEMFVGVGASRVRDLFLQAKTSSPCVIFLDEIDAVGRRRGTGLGGGHDEREQTLNAILVEMDGFDSDEKVIVIAATNRPDVLDPALLRPGRFDRHVYIDSPDLNGRKEIFKVYARRVKLAGDIDFEHLGRMTPGFTGANVEAMMNEAALGAVIRGADAVEMRDLEEARDKIKWGREKRSRKMAEDDRENTAVHESGHAVVTVLSPEVDPLHKVTIVSRGHFLGAAMQLPTRDEYNVTRNKALGQMRVLYGGRAAEKLCAQDISNGAAADISQATGIARHMVCEWGMSEKLGPVNYETSSDNVFLGYDMGRHREFSEDTSQRIDEEVRALIDTAYGQAHKLVEDNLEALGRVKDALLEREVLNRDEVETLMRGEKLPPFKKDEPAAAEATGEESAESDAGAGSDERLTGKDAYPSPQTSS